MVKKATISSTEVDKQGIIDNNKPIEPEITDTGRNTYDNSRSSESNKKVSLTIYLLSGVMGR